MRKVRLLSILLALAMVLTSFVPMTAQAAGKTVTVGTQEELEEALKDPTVTKIAIKAKKGKTLTIPEGDYAHVALVVEAAKVTLNNHGTFKVVKVRDAKEYTEHATGNTVKVTAPKLTVTVAETAEVKALHLAKEDAEHKVEIKGEVAKVTVAESAKVELAVDGTLDTLNVKKASDITVTGTTEETITVNTSTESRGTKVETEVAVDVKAKDFVEVTINEGAEASSVVAKTENADVKVENKTEETVKVETADGTVLEATKEEIVDTRTEEEIVADELAKEEVKSEDEKTEDEKTEDEKTEDEKTEDEKTEDEKVEDEKTEDEKTEDEKTEGPTEPETPAEPETPVVPETPVAPPVVIPTFNVNFDLNGGTGTANAQTIYYGQTATAPVAPEKTGHTFAGWYNGSAEYDFSAPVTGNVTLTAKWSANTYTITFQPDGDNGITTESVVYGTKINAPTTPTKTGYTFNYWLIEDNEETVAFPYEVTGDVIMVGVWTLNNYTVTFNSDGGSEVVPQTVNYNDIAVEPEVPTKTGYIFIDWYLGDAPYAFETPVTEDVTLTAEWEDDPYYVENEDELNAVIVEGGTITVGSDIVLVETVRVPANVEVVLDLNGKTISTVRTETAATCAIENRGNLTIKNGTITYLSQAPDAAYGYGTNTINNIGELTIDGATIINTTNGGSSNAIDNAPGAVLTVNSGTIESKKITIRLRDNTYVTINGGTITGTRAVQIHLFQNVNDDTMLTIKGGTFTGSELALYSIANGSCTFAKTYVQITGGTFNGDVAFGGGNKTAKETVTITGGTFNGELGRYITDGWLDYDVEMMQETLAIGGTYTLQNDIDLSNNTIVIPAGVGAILDLNGHNITASYEGDGHYAMFDVKNGGALTVNGNGNVSVTTKCTTSNRSLAIFANDGELMLNGGNYTLTDSTEGQTWIIATIVDNRTKSSSSAAKVTISGGTYSVEGNAINLFRNYPQQGGSATITFNGGTFKANSTASTTYIWNQEAGTYLGKLNFLGGTYDSNVVYEDYNGHDDITIAEGVTINPYSENN